MLREVTIYHTGANSSGFKLRFSAWPASLFTGWPDEEKMFGTTDSITATNVQVFDTDLTEVGVCVDS